MVDKKVSKIDRKSKISGNKRTKNEERLFLEFKKNTNSIPVSQSRILDLQSDRNMEYSSQDYGIVLLLILGY
uniref:Uncharacterized protein n=1 Tax=Onchocerca volvulus TaxID=6282 RepID=A0A8R1Y7S6_ONCVO